MLFTSSLIKQAHALRKELSISWGGALRLAIKASSSRTADQDSIFMRPSRESVQALAGYFWGLSRGYEESNDQGRAISFKRVARVIYDLSDSDSFTFRRFIRCKYITEQTAQEAATWFSCATQGSFTPRQLSLFKRAPQYQARVHPNRYALPNLIEWGSTWGAHNNIIRNSPSPLNQEPSQKEPSPNNIIRNSRVEWLLSRFDPQWRLSDFPLPSQRGIEAELRALSIIK